MEDLKENEIVFVSALREVLRIEPIGAYEEFNKAVKNQIEENIEMFSEDALSTMAGSIKKYIRDTKKPNPMWSELFEKLDERVKDKELRELFIDWIGREDI